jgi:hypothetical protein
MTRLLSLAALIATAAAATPSPAVDPPRPPNVVILYADDMG